MTQEDAENNPEFAGRATALELVNQKRESAKQG